MKIKLLLAATVGFLALSPSSHGVSMDFLKRGMHCLDGKDACAKHQSLCKNKMIFKMCTENCIVKRRKDAKTEKIKEALLECDEDFIASIPSAAKALGVDADTDDNATSEDSPDYRTKADALRKTQAAERAKKMEEMRRKYGLDKKDR